MGIRGLMSLCLKNKEKCCDFIDLIELSHQQNGIKILVDYSFFQYFIMDKFLESHDNLYLHILGGEYNSLEQYLTKFIKDLLSLGIHLIFFIDGDKGSCSEGINISLEKWNVGQERKCKTNKNILSVCNNEKSIEDLGPGKGGKPILVAAVFEIVLKECNCELFYIAGDVDDRIAKHFLENRDIFAILSDDSDFILFEGCKLIPFKLFDIDNDLKLDNCKEKVPEKPTQLRVGLMSTESVLKILDLPSHDHLVELSIVAGNDFTRHFMKEGDKILYKLDIVYQKYKLENIALWVKRYKKVENHTIFRTKMNYNKEIRDAVQYSRKFYKLEFACDFNPREGPQFQKANTNSSILSLKNGFYWHRAILENISLSENSIEVLLRDIRSCIYRIMLPTEQKYAVEYENGLNFEMIKKHVSVANWKWLPQLDKLCKEKVYVNLRIFHKIMTQQEPGLRTGDWPQNWFDRYGRRNGFIFYCLRYFLLINWNQNLCIEEDEFLALLCLVFSAKNQNQYQHIALRPSARCITIENWLQDIYRHAYCFLGCLLFLQDEFPKPQHMFSGSMWLLYYQSCKYESCSDPKVTDALEQACREMDDILKEKEDMIQDLVGDIDGFQWK